MDTLILGIHWLVLQDSQHWKFIRTKSYLKMLKNMKIISVLRHTIFSKLNMVKDIRNLGLVAGIELENRYKKKIIR